MMLECEVRRGNQWDAIDIEEALAAHKEAELRCIECWGRVCAHKKYSNGTPAHFEHIEAHAGCSQIASSYCGVNSKHPSALK